MKPGILTYSIVAAHLVGLSLCISTGQELPALDLNGPDPGDLVEQISERPASGTTPSLASVTPNAESPVSAEEGESQPGLPDRSDAKSNSFASLERTSMVLTKIRDNKRAVDPFGLPMDPGGLPSGSVLADQYDEIVEEREVSATSLASALQQLSLTGAYPAVQKVVVGPRSFNKGEEFGMRFGELTLRIRFEGIEKKKVYFRDMDTQELAFLDFNPRPQEFEPMFKNSLLTMPDGINPMNKLFIVN